MERLEKVINVSAAISNGIYKLASTMNGPNASGKDASLRLVDGDAYVRMEDHAKVREAMKHSVRDWIKEGRR